MQKQKLHLRLPTDAGPNPYDSKTDPKDYPPKDWQIVGRGFDWWWTILGLGLIMGISAYFKTKT